jgi:hypothetical protein
MNGIRALLPWVGRWLMAVAAIHFVFGIVVFFEPLGQLLRQGWLGGLETEPLWAAVAWFMLFSAPLLLAGLAVRTLERASLPLPAAMGWVLLSLAAVGVAFMPASGFYLLVPPALAILHAARPGRGQRIGA